MDSKDIKTALLWLWVAGAMTAYIYQFKDFVEPLLNLLGFG